MHKLQPIALIVESENTYRIRFKTENGEIEYKFTMESTPFSYLVCDLEFLDITNDDPAAARLKQAICDFHEARHFAYESEEVSKAADIGASRPNTEAAKKASA